MHEKVCASACEKKPCPVNGLAPIFGFPLLHRSFEKRLKPAKNMVNRKNCPWKDYRAMADYSDSEYVPEIKSTVYGIDTALVIVILASAGFWLSVGAAVWLFF